MSKIGRNESCPCGSGKKYKNCCLSLQQEAKAGVAQPATLTQSVSTLQSYAAIREETFGTLGVFMLFSTSLGDAWLLEATEMDAIQVASDGDAITVEIEEGPGTLAVNWTHRFAVQDHGLILTAYADHGESRLSDCPLQQIEAALDAIQASFSPALMKAIHLDDKKKSPQPMSSH